MGTLKKSLPKSIISQILESAIWRIGQSAIWRIGQSSIWRIGQSLSQAKQLVLWQSRNRRQGRIRRQSRNRRLESSHTTWSLAEQKKTKIDSLEWSLQDSGKNLQRITASNEVSKFQAKIYKVLQLRMKSPRFRRKFTKYNSFEWSLQNTGENLQSITASNEVSKIQAKNYKV